MTTELEPGAAVWVQGGERGILCVRKAPDDHLELDMGPKGTCTIPLAAVKPLINTLVELLQQHHPAHHWTEAENHFEYWNSFQERRLSMDFKKFVSVFIYLSSFEHQRTEKSIRYKLRELKLTELIP